MGYEVPTKSEERHRAIMDFLNKIETGLKDAHRNLNKSEYRTLSAFKTRVHGMRFGSKPVLEYVHWADVYNRIQAMLDQPRRVPIPGGKLRLKGILQQEPNLAEEYMPPEPLEADEPPPNGDDEGHGPPAGEQP